MGFLRTTRVISAISVFGVLGVPSVKIGWTVSGVSSVFRTVTGVFISSEEGGELGFPINPQTIQLS